MTRERFATVFQIALPVSRNWEQGRNRPDGAAATMLRMIEAHPRLRHCFGVCDAETHASNPAPGFRWCASQELWNKANPSSQTMLVHQSRHCDPELRDNSNQAFRATALFRFCSRAAYSKVTGPVRGWSSRIREAACAVCVVNLPK